MSAMGTYIYASPMGSLAIEHDGEGVVALRFTEERPLPGGCPQVLADTVRWLDAYFGGEVPGATPAQRLHGTEFQRRVWTVLKDIPYGETITYGELARRVGCRSAQAVGQAVGRNPIAIIIPCHRVVEAGGHLGGYAHGVDRKRRLLGLEKQYINRLKINQQ